MNGKQKTKRCVCVCVLRERERERERVHNPIICNDNMHWEMSENERASFD